jgi:hypothetical protein
MTATPRFAVYTVLVGYTVLRTHVIVTTAGRASTATKVLLSYISYNACMDVWMGGCMDGWMYGWVDVWMYGCMDGYIVLHGRPRYSNARISIIMDGWMDRWMDG